MKLERIETDRQHETPWAGLSWGRLPPPLRLYFSDIKRSRPPRVVVQPRGADAPAQA